MQNCVEDTETRQFCYMFKIHKEMREQSLK